jgi:hypothetical protein
MTMYRTQTSLDGAWEFQTDPDATQELKQVKSWRTAQVPCSWQAQFDDLRQYRGAAWYRRSFDLPAPPAGATILHFGAVDYHATVWINGEPVGEHEGGYLPFEFDVSGWLQAGSNELVVYVVDMSDDRSQWPASPFSEVPHGKQSWYGPIGGIWQSVWLEQRAPQHIQSLRLTPDVAAGTIMVEAATTQSLTAAQLQVTVTGPGGQRVAEQILPGAGGLVALEKESIALWSPDTPALYRVTARLLVDGEPVDEVQECCGFRTVEARDGRIYLNGQPIYLRGALDQAYYPETIYTPPSLDFLEDQVRKAKALGLNCLRIHIKIEDPRYYEVADRLGILVWTEIPNWVLLTPEASARAKATFREMVARDWNHPSIFAWTLVNEDWGTDLVRNPEHRRWLADFTDEAKQLDPTRLVVDNSACRPNFHVAGDLEDYHAYRAIPDHASEWDQWVATFAGRAKWAWSEEYQERRREDLPLIVSEFGNWGLPNPQLIQENGQEPWWFETGHEWGDGIVYPHGISSRFQFWGLDTLFGSLDTFTRQHQRHMARSLAYEIGAMRMQPRIGGYVITEFTDVHWECNGLLDMQRNVKQHLESFVAINQDNAVVVRPQRWSGYGGDLLPVEICAFGVDNPAQTGTLRWHAGSEQGVLPVPGGVVEIRLPNDRPHGLVAIQATWVNDQGQTLATGDAEVAWVSSHTPARRLHVVGDPALARALRDLGYTTVNARYAERDVLLVARHYSAKLRDAVQDGARLLLLASPHYTPDLEDVTQDPRLERARRLRTARLEAKEFRLPVGTLRAREGTPWQGDWATSFSWLKKRGPFAHLPGDPLLGMEYAEIMPDAVLTGLPAWALRDRCWAGLALGWVHKPVALIADIPYGLGKVTISTFNLTPATLAGNAIAESLLDGLIQLADG